MTFDIPKPTSRLTEANGLAAHEWFLFLSNIFAIFGPTGIVSVEHGGTGLDETAQGSLLYGTDDDEYALLSKTATASYLDNSGTTNNPAWKAKAALTKTDDTNVTLTLGGTPATSLLTATSITVGWTGELAVDRGGTGLSSLTLNQIPYGDDSSAFQSSANLTFDGTTLSATNLTLTATGAFIKGDFSNATQASRTLFQTSTANSTTTVGLVPSGSGTVSSLNTYNNSNPTDSAVGQLRTNGSTSVDLRSSVRGTGTLLPLKIIMDSTDAISIATDATITLATKASLSTPMNLKNYTVATLPAGVRGDIAYVTDALAPTYLTAIVGGGAIVTPVFYDGTNWVAY